MKSGLRRAFRALTFVLLGLTLWLAWANVLSDDTAVRAKAEQTARAFAGCNAACRLLDMHGDRGMLSTEVSYTIDKTGVVIVTCRRPQVAFGDHECVAAKP